MQWYLARKLRGSYLNPWTGRSRFDSVSQCGGTSGCVNCATGFAANCSFSEQPSVGTLSVSNTPILLAHLPSLPKLARALKIPFAAKSNPSYTYAGVRSRQLARLHK